MAFKLKPPLKKALRDAFERYITHVKREQELLPDAFPADFDVLTEARNRAAEVARISVVLTGPGIALVDGFLDELVAEQRTRKDKSHG